MQQIKIVIIGAGFSGLCMGIKLKQAGIDDFIIVEKADDLGGTWRENTYPGAECDIPSALYSFSFEHNEKWEFKWSGQAQILKYQHDVAEKYALEEHIRYQHEVKSAIFDEEQQRWLVTAMDMSDPTADTGLLINAQHLITGVGQLHHPSIPAFEDLAAYQGDSFHTAQWNHQIDLKDKRVAVIGNAATAVQFVPQVQPIVAQMTIYQRSPNWILPKQDRPYTRIEQWISGKVPPITKLYRLGLWLKGELGLLPAIRGNRFSRWLLRMWNRRHLTKAIKDPELRAKLTPDYPIGAKRILFADGFYEALQADNVHLDTQGIERFSATGIVGVDGQHREFDVVIFSTGFKTNPFLAPMEFVGIAGKTLKSHWQHGAHAYLGVSTAEFPNLHMMYGPNTNLGHSSIIIMIEAQANYIVQMIQAVDNTEHESIVVRAETEAQYNQRLQARLNTLAFAEVDQSWYKDGGRITNNWAGGTREYMKLLQRFDPEAYQMN